MYRFFGSLLAIHLSTHGVNVRGVNVRGSARVRYKAGRGLGRAWGRSGRHLHEKTLRDRNPQGLGRKEAIRMTIWMWNRLSHFPVGATAEWSNMRRISFDHLS